MNRLGYSYTMNFDTDCSDNGNGNCNDSHNSEDYIMGLLLILVMPLMRVELMVTTML